MIACLLRFQLFKIGLEGPFANGNKKIHLRVLNQFERCMQFDYDFARKHFDDRQIFFVTFIAYSPCVIDFSYDKFLGPKIVLISTGKV